MAKPSTSEQARGDFSGGASSDRPGPRRWVDIWSAGHTVSAVGRIQPVSALIDEIAREYAQAQRQTAGLLGNERRLDGAVA